MTRWFYTDPLAAAWMVKHFGMHFIRTDLMSWQDKLWKAEAIEDARHNGCYYIHPDSLQLLKLRDGDSGEQDGEPGQFRKAVYDGDEFEVGDLVFYSAGAALPYSLDGSEIVTRRDGKAFMWPESEAA